MRNKCKICGKTVKLILHDIYDDRYGAPGLYNIYQCSSCGYGFTDSKINPKEIGKFYSKYYPLSEITSEQVKKSALIRSTLYTWFIGTYNAAYLYIKPRSLVLDIGSGNCQSLIEIIKLKGIAFGVEPDPNAQKIAKKLHLNVHQGLITDNPFPDKKFDFVTANQVLEHDPNPRFFLKAIKRKLRSNGMVILSFPNCDSLYRKIFGGKWIHWHVPYHCNFFTKKSFEILTNEAGFKIIKSKTITPNLWTILQIRSILTSPKINKKNTTWNIQHHWSNKKSIRAKIITSALKLILNLFIILVAPINRIIDSLGQGESFFVWLKNENT